MAHNFRKKMDEIWDKEKYPPGVYGIIIAHDNWCPYLDGSGDCNCDPDIIVKKIEEVLSNEQQPGGEED